QRWHLRHDFGLGTDGPVESEPDRFRYHPDHPTPVIGGPVLLADSRPRDQRRLEARRDVLVYSSPALESDLEMIGPVSAELYVRASTPYADVVVRVCDVHPDGRSMNVCEGVRRLGPPDADTLGDVRRVRVELWPIGHRFRRDHRIRVHVAAGAYPTIARNPGTGDPLGAAGGPMVPNDVEVFHSPDHPPAVILPLCAPPGWCRWCCCGRGAAAYRRRSWPASWRCRSAPSTATCWRCRRRASRSTPTAGAAAATGCWRATAPG